MSKFLELINSNQPIIPVPDFDIIHRDGRYVLVECHAERPTYEVISFVRREVSGNWQIGKWVNIIDSEKIEQANPHKNQRGMWVWLLESV